MAIIKLKFNETENSCEMYKGSVRLELYTYNEGEIILSALQALKTLDVIELEIEYSF